MTSTRIAWVVDLSQSVAVTAVVITCFKRTLSPSRRRFVRFSFSLIRCSIITIQIKGCIGSGRELKITIIHYNINLILSNAFDVIPKFELILLNKTFDWTKWSLAILRFIHTIFISSCARKTFAEQRHPANNSNCSIENICCDCDVEKYICWC